MLRLKPYGFPISFAISNLTRKINTLCINSCAFLMPVITHETVLT
jgi:hypothetical protein